MDRQIIYIVYVTTVSYRHRHTNIYTEEIEGSQKRIVFFSHVVLLTRVDDDPITPWHGYNVVHHTRHYGDVIRLIEFLCHFTFYKTPKF